MYVHVYMCMYSAPVIICTCKSVCAVKSVGYMHAHIRNGLDNMCVQVWTCCGKCVGMYSASRINRQDCVIECVVLPNLQ